MKKAIALSFLLLANVVLLAHEVVPHHSDEQMLMCFEAESSKHQHEHEEFPLSEKCCFIDYAFTLPHNHIKTNCHIHKKCDCGQVYELISNTLNTQDFVDDTLIHFRQNPCVLLFYSEFVSQSIGLRAPPAFN